MSVQIFQNIINQMKDVINREIGVVDTIGTIIACSDSKKNGEMRSGVRGELTLEENVIVINGYSYRSINNSVQPEYAVYVEGEDSVAEKISAVLMVTFGNIKTLYEERNDKSALIKNILLDNILPNDIYVKAKELHFSLEEPRVVFLVNFHTKNNHVPYDMIQNLFPDKENDFLVSVGEQSIALVKGVKSFVRTEELESIAREIADTLSGEFYITVSVGVGTVVDNIKYLARSFKEAMIALEVGKIFDADKNIICYEDLGIARLIYQLPTTMCDMFIKEVFKREAYESLDNEILSTVVVFFENNLNVSETARKLFVHRNTLVYRLDKVQRLTGLDLREFDHAITFKVAMLVKKYLTNKYVHDRR
ncbi:MAG: helix-turn-helix domain-containing protein [Oscillospiraceae bacterium]|nr:helix-turn-helix domain-containing protein [Oscillospiraceae bacterium]